MEDVDSIKLPHLYIYHGKQLTLPDTHFKNSVGADSIQERTLVQMMYDENNLVIEFECLENPRTFQNNYRENNSAMWNQEVFEIFISPGEDDPSRYMEVEINSNGAIFLAWVNNKDKLGSQLELDFVDVDNSGVKWEVEKDEVEDSWRGSICIPFKLLNNALNEPCQNYRINFFRIISLKDREEEFWSGSAEDCIYACWNSTHSKEQPCFHRTPYFGVLHLV